MITVAHIRQAIEIACAGGTNEHPYDQTSWGGSECGTACCVYGQAAVLAGVQGVYTGPVDVEATPEAGTLARLMWTTSPDVLLVMRGVQPDGSIDLHGSDLASTRPSGVCTACWPEA